MAEDPLAKERQERSHTRQTERLARAMQDHHQAERPKHQAPTPTEESSPSSASPLKKVRFDTTQRSKPEDDGMGGTVIGSPNAPGSSSGGDRRVEEEKKINNEE